MPRNPDLRHVYATVSEFNDTIVDDGGVLLTNAANNARKLEILDEVSRLVDARAHRGSGFGPWVGTKHYDGDGRATLWLRADLAELDTLSVASAPGATPETPLEDDDFYLAGLGSYDPPYRRIVFHGQGSPTRFGRGLRLTSVTGTWSFPYRTLLLSETVDEDVDDVETDIDVTGLSGLEAGMTLLIDDEQMYVTATTAEDGETSAFVTVERGVNGTTAATHATDAPISRFMYDPSVHGTVLRLALRRWKARDAGGDGSDGGADVGSLSLREGEDTILRRMLGATVMLVGEV